jgi:uncharacterized protein YbjT (DUF2867 family)
MFLITGATGNVGSELVIALAEAGESVRALTRSASLPDGWPSGVRAVIGDLNNPNSLSAALDGVDGVFLLSGYADMPGLFAAIRRAEVKRVVLLSSGAVENGDGRNAVVRYNMLSEAAARESGVPTTILRPSGFQSNALQWVPQLRAGDVVREPFADVPIAAIDPFDIAAVAALSLTRLGDDSDTYRLTGPEPIVPADRVRILGAVLNRKLRLEPLSNADARKQMSADMPAEYVDAFFSFFADGDYDDSRVQPTVEQLTGRTPRTFTEWATAHADAFR